MGMNNAGNTNQAVSGINVTPLIDVLLVLLIIFMVIVPVTPRGLGALVPQPPKDARPDPGDTIVVQVLGTSAAPTYKINEDSFAIGSLEPRLAAIFALRQEKVMFVQGDAGVDYAHIAEVIDLGRQAGVDNIGLLTPGTNLRR